MAFLLTCTCGARFEVDEAWAGKTISCPDCRQSLTVPPLPTPTQPTNALALLSAVLALVGAFTLVGSVVAVVLGLAAVIQIGRQRDRAPGLGYALFGIAAGIAGTALTVLAFRSPDLFGLGPYFRASQWADKVDFGGELTFESTEGGQGFRISRPSHDWGVVREKKVGNGILDALQLTPPRVLFMQTTRFAFVDVTIEQVNDKRPLSEFQETFLADLTRERPDEGDRFGPRRSNGSRISRAALRKGCEGTTLKVGDNEFLEFVVDLHCGDQPWSMIVRLCQTRGNKLFTLRAYAPHRTFDKVEDECRKILDTFRTIP